MQKKWVCVEVDVYESMMWMLDNGFYAPTDVIDTSLEQLFPAKNLPPKTSKWQSQNIRQIPKNLNADQRTIQYNRDVMRKSKLEENIIHTILKKTKTHTTRGKDEQNYLHFPVVLGTTDTADGLNRRDLAVIESIDKEQKVNLKNPRILYITTHHYSNVGPVGGLIKSFVENEFDGPRIIDESHRFAAAFTPTQPSGMAEPSETFADYMNSNKLSGYGFVKGQDAQKLMTFAMSFLTPDSKDFYFSGSSATNIGQAMAASRAFPYS